MKQEEFCHRCKRQTRTIPLKLSSGHYGNCCGVCRATRKGKPFLSRVEYEVHITNRQPPMPVRAEGIHEHQTSP